MSNMSILSIMMCIIITLETLPTKLLRPVLSSTHLVSFKNICEEDFTKQATKQSSVYRFIFHHPPLLSRLLKVDNNNNNNNSKNTNNINNNHNDTHPSSPGSSRCTM